MSERAGMQAKSFVDREGKTRWYHQTTDEARLNDRLHYQTRAEHPMVYVEMPHPYVYGAKRGYYRPRKQIENDPGFEIAAYVEWKGVQLETWREVL